MMKVKKIGKAKMDLKTEIWYVEGRSERYEMSRRMIDAHPDIKSFRSENSRMIQTDTPSLRKPLKREAYFQAREEYRAEWSELLKRVHQEIREGSFEVPVPLKKNKDYDHPREWRHCLYQGNVYESDRQGCTASEMKEAIQAVEGIPEASESSEKKQ